MRGHAALDFRLLYRLPVDIPPLACAGPRSPPREEIDSQDIGSRATVVTLIDRQDPAPNAESTPKGKEIARLLRLLLLLHGICCQTHQKDQVLRLR